MRVFDLLNKTMREILLIKFLEQYLYTGRSIEHLLLLPIITIIV